ncbi:MAG: prepilin-type N-terminal cleavage/methylation domain-containing protein [Curvibacter sp.]|nr:prepilin-type N-terminal cleavage/methylation domain-containing protein [Curvibacter sp.]
MSTALKNPKRLYGFTLIELMIALAIVAILAAIALPAYKQQIMKSRRTDAITALMDMAAREERWYSTNNSYTGYPSPATSLLNLGYASTVNGGVLVPSTTNATYLITVTAAGSSSYNLTATPQGNQVNDACGTYSLTQVGAQGNTPPTGVTLPSDCWRR